MLGRIALVVSIALALSACGSARPRSAKRTPPSNGTVAKGESSLRVRHVIDPHSPPVYIEGAVWHVRVLDSNGAAVIDRQLFDRQTSVRLRPGEYRLESEELPCSVNCDRLTRRRMRVPPISSPSLAAKWLQR